MLVEQALVLSSRSSERLYSVFHVSNEGVVFLGDIRFLGGPEMNENAVSQVQGFSFPKRVTTILRLVVVEIVKSERIGSKEAVATDMPMSGVSKALWMAEYRDSDCLVVDFC